ncbi:MAG TPA: hypothetical protein VIJ14_10595, partial [Rhabdochlamydiaceae bacterium]
FLILLVDYKDRANRAAQVEIKKSKKQFKQSKVVSTLESARLLAQSANELKFVKVQSKPTAKDAGMAHVYSLPVVKGATSAAIQAYGRNLFTFIGDEKNLAGIAQRGMEAFLNKAPMMPKKQRVDVGIFAAVHTNAHPARPLSSQERKKLAATGWVALT